MCLRPSWTAIVWPTISGKIVDARDQVFSIVLEFEAFSASTRAIRRSSTHGPFLLDRLTARSSCSTLLPSPATAHDVAVGCLVLLTSPVAERRDAPRGDRVTAGRGRSLTTAVRVVDRVHRRSAGLRADAHVALASGLADLHVLVIGVADRTDRATAV